MSVQVSCRLRHEARADEQGASVVSVDDESHPGVVRVRVDGNKASETTEELSFALDRVFPPSITQLQVYDAVARPCVRDLIDGYHCSILAYGQTGSGKTFTTIGGETDESQGLIPRLLHGLFAEIASSQSSEVEITLSASFLEIYQERLRDLLVPSNSRRLQIREDAGSQSVWVDGAAAITLSSASMGLQVLSRGLKQRAVGATAMNGGSSRSHAVLALTLSRLHTATRSCVRTRLCVVDLAGSEKLCKTLVSGQRLDEAKHINKSLSALGNVIYALTSSSPSAYVPYRDSKLTRLLQTSLGGNAKTHLLLCCSDDATHVSETLSTLRFGLRARAMQNRPERVRTLLSTRSNEDESLERLRILEQKLASLYDYIRQLETAACPNCSIAAKEGPSAMRPATSQEEGEKEEPSEERLRDELMDAELQTLRGTLAAMQQQLHVRDLAQSLDKTLVTSLESLHSQQERTLRQQEQQLTEADAAIASLQSQLRAGNEEQHRLKVALRRLEAVKRDHDDASQAENEILRRRLEQIEQRDAQTLKELVLSRRREQELVAMIQQHEAEVARLRLENEELSGQLSAPAPTSSSPRLVAPLSPGKQLLRPVTCDSSCSRNNNAMAIQSWWAGDKNDPEGPMDVSSRQQRQLGDENARRNVHTSVGGARPALRSRLVGLLTSLEEETSSFKALVNQPTDLLPPTKRPNAAIPGHTRMTRKPLPALGGAIATDTTHINQDDKP